MEKEDRGLIAWFARNSVAANLLMVFIIIGGLFTATTIRKQMFPQFDVNWIHIVVAYPGAAPQEVEEGITIKIEEALQGLQGIERVISDSNRGMASLYIEVEENYDASEVLNEIKLQVDGIPSLPDGAERPTIYRQRYQQEVMYISLYGDLSDLKLKALGLQIHEEIRNLPKINITELYSGLDYEIGIEVSRDKLREYGLSFDDVANAVRGFSANRSAGQIRGENGYISLRTSEQAYYGVDFEALPLINHVDGTQIRLGDVAIINDGFEEGIQYAKYNGKNAVFLFVGAASDQSISPISDTLKEYIEERQKSLPEGVFIESWVDFTYYLDGRLDMMLSNMAIGGILVFIMLALFLQFRLAFWVIVGLPVCFLGTLLMMPLEWVDVTINVTSLFGFILVLGIVVDDAIVIGESAYTEIEQKGQTVDTVIRGVNRVALPATFGVLTTIAAFFPLILADGPSAAFSQSIGFVVIFCLVFSLIESKLILPAHIARMKISKPNYNNPYVRLRNTIDNRLKQFIANKFRPFLERAIYFRYTVIALFVGVVFISAGLFIGGLVKFIGSPKIPHDFPSIKIEMNQTASERFALDALLAVEKLILDVDKEIEKEYGTGMLESTYVELRSRTLAEISTKLIDPDLRPLDTFELADRWRDALPALPGVKNITVEDNLFGSGRNEGDLTFRLMGDDLAKLRLAAGELKEKLKSLKGVGDVNDSDQGKIQEVRFTLTPLARSLGLTTSEVARQLNYGFYGLEAQRVLRNGEEIKVMVRYPTYQRNSLTSVEDALILLPSGEEIPVSEIAETSLVDGENQIHREEGRRTLSVWASVNSDVVEPNSVAKDLKENFIPELLKRYPEVSSETAGRIEKDAESNSEQMRNFLLSMMVVYILLAVSLRSYAQPLMIMTAIPFGAIGAMLGHLILGMDLSSMSGFGIIAAAGVVVNDSLVMVDFVNKNRAEGYSTAEAVVNAGCRRFRAIMLTSITTFVGLIPIITETSLQAKIVIPMAVSLAFGVLFATVITLILIPCLYVAGTDLGNYIRKLRAYLFDDVPENKRESL